MQSWIVPTQREEMQVHGQQWIVFTAWEQVESSGAGQRSKQDAGLRQDYDARRNETGADSNGDGSE